ncbi:hypothetical protein HUJ04_005040 [Dendroctonus ponderosae]|nr:hypothetical protein HUJ04_005040 [Dendroctonus ponderosae]
MPTTDDLKLLWAPEERFSLLTANYTEDQMAVDLSSKFLVTFCVIRVLYAQNYRRRYTDLKDFTGQDTGNKVQYKYLAKWKTET